MCMSREEIEAEIEEKFVQLDALDDRIAELDAELEGVRDERAEVYSLITDLEDMLVG